VKLQLGAASLKRLIQRGEPVVNTEKTFLEWSPTTGLFRTLFNVQVDIQRGANGVLCTLHKKLATQSLSLSNSGVPNCDNMVVEVVADVCLQISSVAVTRATSWNTAQAAIKTVREGWSFYCWRRLSFLRFLLPLGIQVGWNQQVGSYVHKLLFFLLKTIWYDITNFGENKVVSSNAKTAAGNDARAQRWIEMTGTTLMMERILKLKLIVCCLCISEWNTRKP
jgi:hypothetical protein